MRNSYAKENFPIYSDFALEISSAEQEFSCGLITPVAFVALFSESLPVVSIGICRASRVRSHPEHGENLERW